MSDAAREGKGGRAAILAAAEALFEAEGAEGFTVRAVAVRCGMTATALYRHFTDRDALLGEVLAAARRRFDDALARGADLPDPVERLLATGEGYLRFVAAHPQSYRALFLGPPRTPRHFTRDFAEGRAAGFQLLVGRIGACQAAGRLPPGDPLGLALTLWSSIHGLSALWITGQLGLGRAAFLRRGRDLTRWVTRLAG